MKANLNNTSFANDTQRMINTLALNFNNIAIVSLFLSPIHTAYVDATQLDS